MAASHKPRLNPEVTCSFQSIGTERRTGSLNRARRSGEPLEKMDVNLPPGIVRLHPLRLQAYLLVHLDPPLKVGNGSWVCSHDFELVAGGHALDLLLRFHDRYRALQSPDIELLHVHPVLLAQGLARV